jgi:hypothetical protein
MIHPDTELKFKDPVIGLAVHATRFIPRGTIVWTLCDLDIRLPPSSPLRAPGSAYRPIVDRYAYGDAEGDLILCWDHGRYVNHSCEPAMIGVGPDIEIAVRDIQPGDELTCEYGCLNLHEVLQCRCGAASCRGTIGGDDMLRLWPQIDQAAASAVALARSVAQPLAPFVRDAASWAAWRDGSAPVPSSRQYHHDPLRTAA